ncbi:MAG: TonB-dependent receptor, partial [Asticcacaulis sp.]
MRNSMLSKRATLGSAAAISVLLLAVPALAQEAQTPPSDTIEEVIVTVQKREQAIKDVPATITAYGGAQLERTGITEFDKLSTFVPGFEVQNQSPNNPGFVVRGLTSDSLSGYSEPRVSVFQDGVSITRSAGSYIELFDIERVEIAKGPQSTLFGRGSLIGGVNVIQKKAKTGAFDAGGAVSFGNFNARSLEGMINMPMGETFALRVSGRVAERDGYVKNLLGGDLNSQDTRAGRIAARWEPMANLSFDLIGNYQKDEPAATAFKSHLIFPSNLTTGAVTGTLKPQDAAALALPKGFLGGKSLGLDREVYGLTLISNYQISDSLKLNSTTAWRGFEATETGDSDGTAAEIISFANVAKGRQWSQEFRLNFDDGGPVSWFAGVGYFQEKASDATPAQFDERYALAQLTGQLNMSAFGSGLGAGRIAPSAFLANPAVTGALLQGAAASLSGNRLLLSAPVAQAIAANLKTGHLETARD